MTAEKALPWGPNDSRCEKTMHTHNNNIMLINVNVVY